MNWIALILFCVIIPKAQAKYDDLYLINHQNVANSLQKFATVSTKTFIDDDICNNDLNLFGSALDKKEPWAIKLVDTWAKISAGYMSGNKLFIGDFDSCIKFQHKQPANKLFQGQHCLVALSALPNSTLNDDRNDLSLKHVANFFRDNRLIVTNGFCVPNTCSSNKTVQFLNQRFLLKNDLIALGAACRDIHDLNFTALDYFAIAIFSIIIILMILSTLYDMIKSKSKNPQPNKLLASFSAYTNGFKLFDVTKIKSSTSINCLHGLRSMSIFWIILGHRIGNQYPWGNLNDVDEFTNGSFILGAIIKAHPLAVDTFFVMGALLMTWSTLRDCEKQQMNIPRMIWRRYLRYTFVYAALILAVICFSKVLLQGPFYIEELRVPCVNNWWYALLHIQNYLPFNEMCLNHGWYLSADFQLFIISPFIISLIHKYGRKLLLLPAVLCFATIVYIIIISMIFKIEMPSPKASNNYLKYIYYVTHSRAGPWFIGIILGYFLYTHRGKVFKLNKIFNAALWISSLSILFTIIELQFVIAVTTEPISRAAHVSYLALQRNLWAIAICWIIFACQNLKTGGIVRWFLSLPQWQPISRMGLSMYLIGAVYQVMMILNQRVPLYIGFWSFIPVLVSDVIIIAAISVFSYLAFEAPPLIIEDYIYNKIKGKISN